MTYRITDNGENIDGKTSRSICDAVGLRQNMLPEQSNLPSHLQQLIDELHRQESRGLRASSN